jgi:glycyl-tRNA synthetase beta chain
VRRAAQGVVRILVEGGLRLPIQSLLEGNEQLEEFFLDRIRYYFRETCGFAYDEVNAVLSAAWDDLVDAHLRLEAIQEVRPTEDFEPLAASFRRIQNILKQAQFEGTGADVEESLLEDGAEMELYLGFEKVRNYIRENAGELGYPGVLAAIATLRPNVDKFFDKVMVNVQNPAVRQNRLTLLYNMLEEFSSIADFSEIVTTSQEMK